MNNKNKIPLKTESGCFACGKDNEIGLRMDLFYLRNEGIVTSEMNLSTDYAGFHGIIHGGIVTTMMDEAMAWSVIIHTGKPAVTMNINVNYLLPVRPESVYIIRSKIIKQNNDNVIVESSVEDSRNKLYAHSEGVFKVLSGANKRFGDYSLFARSVKNGI